jgi:SAM-dependent methyltransferase
MHILDAGCGEGQYVFPFAEKYPARRFTGVDKQTGNIAFCNHYAAYLMLENTSFEQQDICNGQLTAQADLVLLISVLNYVEDDAAALRNISKQLAPGGRLLLYAPVNNRHILPFYPALMQRYPNYESIQGRKRNYTPQSLHSLLQAAGLEPIYQQYGFGFWGILSNECMNTVLILANQLHPVLRLCLLLISLLCYPLYLCMLILDYVLPKKEGNGLLLVLRAWRETN